MIDKRPRAAGRRQLQGVDVVLEDDRHAVERAAHASGRALRVGARASAIARGLIDSIARTSGRGDRTRQPRQVLADDVLARVAPAVIASCSCSTVFSKTVNGGARRGAGASH